MSKKISTDTSLSKDDKLDLIVDYLYQMNKRDRMRTIGGFFKSILMLIPTVLFLWSIYYFYLHGDEILEKIAKTAAQQAAEVTQKQGGALMKQLQQMVPQ